MKLFFAPLQGYTDAAYRRFHNEVFEGCIDCYYTPFLRIERKEVRNRDLRDILPENNEGVNIVPQIIVKDVDEFRVLVETVLSIGYDDIDINMGCPFPLQTKKGRGAGLLRNPDIVAEIFNELKKYPNVKFSVKMRLGYDEKSQWQQIMPILNEAPLSHITLHSRIATQQYKGDVDLYSFRQFYNESNHRVVYNGDISTIEDIIRLKTEFSNLHGVMVGRGLLSSPSLAWEYLNNVRLSSEQQIEKFLMLHNKLFQFYESKLQGDSHLLTKMKTLWDYSEPLIGHKSYKQIKKSSNIAKYMQLVSSLIK